MPLMGHKFARDGKVEFIPRGRLWRVEVHGFQVTDGDVHSLMHLEIQRGAGWQRVVAHLAQGGRGNADEAAEFRVVLDIQPVDDAVQKPGAIYSLSCVRFHLIC